MMSKAMRKALFAEKAVPHKSLPIAMSTKTVIRHAHFVMDMILRPLLRLLSFQLSSLDALHVGDMPVIHAVANDQDQEVVVRHNHSHRRKFNHNLCPFHMPRRNKFKWWQRRLRSI